jgi:hypothetical protein
MSQYFGSNPDSGFDDKKLEKILTEKIILLSKIAIYLSLVIQKRTSKLQKKPSALKREHPTLQNMKFLNLFYYGGSFLPSLIRTRIPNPLI